MVPEELAQMNTGFDRHAVAHGVLVQTSQRFGFVALEGEAFIGCASGLAYQNGDVFSGWFYLTDLYVAQEWRGRGVGARLLAALEGRLADLGISRVWTWTAGYEGPGFYKKAGYEVFAELEGWYSDGSSRLGFRKKLSDPPTAG